MKVRDTAASLLDEDTRYGDAPTFANYAIGRSRRV